MTWPDYAILVASLVALLGIGAWFNRSQTDTQEFFLAGRHVPWWAVLLAFLATEISALTIIGVPATAYRESWEYLQFQVGSSASKVAIALLFVPAFYAHEVTTIYELLGHRFGRETQVTSSVFFFVTRLLGSGVRLMVAAAAVAMLLDWPLVPTIVLFTVVSIVYIGSGGVSAIVWGNVLQAVVFIAAGVATLAFLAYRIDGGVGGAIDTARAAGRLRVINWGPAPGDPGFLAGALADPKVLWAATLNGFVGSLAAFGTDHDLMQRLLTVETRRESQRTLILSPVITVLVLLLYLSIGTGLYAFYAQNPTLAPAAKDLERVLPHFALHTMPAGLRGFLLAAIVLASIDSPLGALAASFVTDIYRPLLAKDRAEEHYLRVSRASVLVFGLVLGVLAYGFSFYDKHLWLAFKITGVTFGSLLGVFLLALLTTRRLSDRGNVVAMVVMALVNLVLLVLIEAGKLALGWSWLVVIGTLGTMLLAVGLAGLSRGDAGAAPRADSDASRTP